MKLLSVLRSSCQAADGKTFETIVSAVTSYSDSGEPFTHNFILESSLTVQTLTWVRVWPARLSIEVDQRISFDN